MNRLVAERLASLRDGAPGAAGEKGDRGERGEAGGPGLQGLPGKDGADGERGEPGLPGERGERGEAGPQGSPGLDGLPGVLGERGPIGERGESGPKGEPGEKGQQGAGGERGEKGDAGARGEQGERGMPGVLPPVQIWKAGVHYEGDVVSARGGTWQARQDTAEEPGSGAHWVALAQPGISPRIRGRFDDGATYRELDIVALNGGSFIARRDEPGACPGDGWQLLASQGKSGGKGERGPIGERGQKGETGIAGAPAPTIRKWQIDRARFVAVPIMSDESKGAELELRALFEQYQTEAVT
jgi:hypothetical protein